MCEIYYRILLYYAVALRIITKAQKFIFVLYYVCTYMYIYYCHYNTGIIIITFTLPPNDDDGSTILVQFLNPHPSLYYNIL